MKNFGSDAGRAVAYAMAKGSGDFMVSAVALNKVLRSMEPLKLQVNYRIEPVVEGVPKYKFVKEDKSMNKCYFKLGVTPEYIGGHPWNSHVVTAELISEKQYSEVPKVDMQEVWGCKDQTGVSIVPSDSEEHIDWVQSGKGIYSTKMVGFVENETGAAEAIYIEMERESAETLVQWITEGYKPYVMHRL